MEFLITYPFVAKAGYARQPPTTAHSPEESPCFTSVLLNGVEMCTPRPTPNTLPPAPSCSLLLAPAVEAEGAWTSEFLPLPSQPSQDQSVWRLVLETDVPAEEVKVSQEVEQGQAGPGD